MWSIDPAFLHPSDDVTLWRYLSTEKFLSLLSSQTLHLARLDHLDDPWEGVLTVSQEQKQLATAPIGDAWNASQLRAWMLEAKKRVFVNCWHASEYESAAMWELYASRNAGVALKATARSIRLSIKSSLELRLIQVEYIDYLTHAAKGLRSFGDGSTHTSVAYKRKSFEHEREVRIVYVDWNGAKPGALVPVSVELELSLADLLLGIYAAPSMPKWQVTSLREVTARFGIDPTLVGQSTLFSPQVS